MRNAPIGVMDSGVGGLTVVAEIWRQLPREQVLFYGDSLRCPYGDRPREEIAAFTFQALDFLVAQGVKMLVIACNTATAVCLEEARIRYDVPVIGVIAPGARAAIAATMNKRIGVIGTKATVESDSYPRALKQTHGGLHIRSLACPHFVSLVESDRVDREQAWPIVFESLAPLTNEGIDTLILGCTHYPLLASVIAEAVGSSVKLISSAEETARDVSLWLTEHHMTRIEWQDPAHLFYTSGSAERFGYMGERWLGKAISVHHADVWASEEKAL
ncbi:MAG: glutamate racemase [Firmicutes bacterium]|nr:glutamate racemase [Bacillota bacterium]